MNWKMHPTAAPIAFSLMAMSSWLSADTKEEPLCEPTTTAACSPTECCNTYCVGPNNYGINAPVRPRLCKSDLVLEIDAFYWSCHQDGMQYAIETESIIETINDPPTILLEGGNTLINADYKSPNFKWEFGFKAGIGYDTSYEGWDLELLWTRYVGKASSHIEAETSDNQAILPLWSSYPIRPEEALGLNSLPVAKDSATSWKLHLDWIDLELGREFWIGQKTSLRPHVGLRIASIRQDFNINYSGYNNAFDFDSQNLIDFVKIDNDFKGAGVRVGFDSVWNLGRGFGICGNTALSLLYGRFNIDHKEYTQATVSPFAKTSLLETHDGFRASRLAIDLGLGVQWSKLICRCRYGLTVGLAWEQHLFLDQNQMWRVNTRLISEIFESDVWLYATGNSYEQRRGDLDTQGWTLKVRFEF